ncbi:FGGY-family carbohydrate kinase [Novipirellula artificiosorum]|uniref:L-xylulose/3-keto-L-gulonate kinase n=1 Tax=Novipirellula artificiosorum TaxID=2528016 RepID=A0A5C6DSQ6_9BACT|nr:FGGY-family carbohydrate kinase [Novipirellula artificiosorum]TWU39768.1 L-xylulose/3-keto-L-gulonate kinase [Novipirellula artificiosorum]
MSERYLLGVDNGGTVAKAALFDLTGKELAIARRNIELEMPHADWHEIDSDRLWQATAEAIREVIRDAKVAAKEIVSVSCTGHGNGLYLVDEAGRPTRKGISSSDSRARDYVENWNQDGIIEKLRPKTLQCNWPAQPNALLRWMIDNEPETLQRSRWALMCKDYVRMRLTGEAHAELTDYSGTSLMDVRKGEYDDEIFEAFGIESTRKLMPPVVRSTQAAGSISASAASETGLAEGTAVYGGAFDIDACGLAAGCIDPDSMVMVGGTWGNNQYITPEPLCSADVFMVSRYAIDGYYLVLEGSATSASNLEWFVDLMLADQRQQSSNVYRWCDNAVGESAPTISAPMFLPFLYGSPVNPNATGTFLGLTGQTDRAAMARAIFEGVCFMHHWHWDRLMQFRPCPKIISMTGGVARSEVWCQMFADVFNVPVQVPEAEELGALGAAMIASIGHGIYPDLAAACEQMTRINRRHEPRSEQHAVYSARRKRFLATLDALCPIWNSL